MIHFHSSLKNGKVKRLVPPAALPAARHATAAAAVIGPQVDACLAEAAARAEQAANRGIGDCMERSGEAAKRGKTPCVDGVVDAAAQVRTYTAHQ